MKVLIWPYNRTSQSAKAISIATGWKRMIRNSVAPAAHTLVVNWGSSAPPTKYKRNMLNPSTDIASNKLSSFQQLSLHGVPVPGWTPEKAEAKFWLQKGDRVFARQLLSSHSGKGIVNLKGGDAELPKAPLYVKYVQKDAEYRVHATKEKSFLVQQKKRRAGVEVKDQYIRSWWNGYVFCKNDIEEPKGIRELAVKAVQAVGLDFGAVDIIRSKKDGKLLVLEVNTAPGVDNSQAKEYAVVLKELANAYAR